MITVRAGLVLVACLTGCDQSVGAGPSSEAGFPPTSLAPRGDEAAPRPTVRLPGEPPIPPMQAHPCDAFETTAELVELKLASDYNPEPYGLLIPVEYLWASRAPGYRSAEIDGLFLMNAWVHDFAPWPMSRFRYSTAKDPNDDIGLLVRGGEGGPGDGLDVYATKLVIPPLGPTPRTLEAVRKVAEDEGWDDEMNTWRIKSDVAGSPGLEWIAFGEEGEVTDVIICRRGPNNARCRHEIAFGAMRPKVTYDIRFRQDWRRIRSMTETFFACARERYVENASG